MKFARMAALALAAAALPTPAAAQDFEGTVTYKMTMGPMTMDMTQFIKGKKVRQEMGSPMGNVVTIIDTETGRMGMQVPGQPMQVMDMEAMKAMAGQAAGAEAAKPEVTATGQTETIAGYSCEHYKLVQGAQQVDVCVASGLGFIAGSGDGPASSLDMDELRELFKDGYFPLKMTASTPQGDMVMEAVSLERKSLSDTLFNISG